MEDIFMGVLLTSLGAGVFYWTNFVAIKKAAKLKVLKESRPAILFLSLLSGGATLMGILYLIELFMK